MRALRQINDGLNVIWVVLTFIVTLVAVNYLTDLAVAIMPFQPADGWGWSDIAALFLVICIVISFISKRWRYSSYHKAVAIPCIFICFLPVVFGFVLHLNAIVNGAGNIYLDQIDTKLVIIGLIEVVLAIVSIIIMVRKKSLSEHT